MGMMCHICVSLCLYICMMPHDMYDMCHMHMNVEYDVSSLYVGCRMLGLNVFYLLV